MVRSFKNLALSILIFAVLITLCVNIWSGFKDTYGVTDEYTVDEKNIALSLNDLNLIKSLNRTATSAYTIVAPTSSIIDVLGGLASAAIGTIQVMGSIITLPIEVMGVITNFYTIPAIIPIFIGVALTIIIGLIILSKFLGGGGETV